jgi:hypothetical protein
MEIICSHSYKPVVLNNEEWVSLAEGQYGKNQKPCKNISQAFHLYCERCGDIINPKDGVIEG